MAFGTRWLKGPDRFWYVVGIGFLTPILFALWDLYGAYMWRLIGGWEGAAYTAAMPTYQAFVWGFAKIAIIVIAIVYYLATRDKSESLAIGLIPLILLEFGAEDVWFYILGGYGLLATSMPWLTLPVPTFISHLFGAAIITGPILLVSAAVGYVVSYKVADYLVKVRG